MSRQRYVLTVGSDHRLVSVIVMLVISVRVCASQIDAMRYATASGGRGLSLERADAS